MYCYVLHRLLPAPSTAAAAVHRTHRALTPIIAPRSLRSLCVLGRDHHQLLGDSDSPLSCRKETQNVWSLKEFSFLSHPQGLQMSLLLELIRQLLDYLGIPTDRLVPIWENYIHRRSFLRTLGNHLPAVLFQRIDIQFLQIYERKDYGWTRSLVRIMGTLLPLEPCHRPHFQRVLDTGVLQPKGYGAVCRTDIPSLADAPCLLDDDAALSYTRFRRTFPSVESVGNHMLTEHSENTPGCTLDPASRVSENGDLAPSEHAIQKIAALEDELAQLRAQIAAIVAIQESQNLHSCSETICSFGSPSNALPPPSLASTPLSLPFMQPAKPAPPPPPPPPVPAVKINSAKSAIDLIKERKASHRKSPIQEEEAERGKVTKLPSMLDVLKDMNSIRLRAVERSPGGTPLTSKHKKRRSLNDPAAIIAHALKQKFAHRHNDDSFDKENRSHEESTFSSPETPMFGRHLLKPAGKRTQMEMSKKQVIVRSGAHV